MNDQPLASAVAIVTGGSRGIGAAIVRRFAQQGAAIVFNYARREAEAHALADALGAGGARVVAQQADIADPASARALFDRAESAFGPVSILVNNAGILPSSYPTLGTASDALIDEVFDVNVKGVLYALREAAGRMREGGRIINFSSSAIALQRSGYGLYCASKAAVEALGAIFAKELRGRSITVNTVAPGPVDTELFRAGKSEETIAQLAKASPLERLGRPEDIADVVAFLAGPQGTWINGQVLRANGGMV